MATYGYVTTAEITAFMQLINPSFVDATINDIIANAGYETINARLDTNFAEEKQTYFVDGTGDNFIYCPRVPIIDMFRISLMDEYGKATDYVLGGSAKNIWWDNSTGRIWISVDPNMIEREFSEYITEIYFPNRTNAIRIEGRFGSTPTNLVKQLQLMLILKQYSLLQPSTYASDIIEEQIGKYSYKLANASNVAPENQRVGLDGWINKMFALLRTPDTLGMESI